MFFLRGFWDTGVIRVETGVVFREPRFASVSLCVITEIDCTFVRWTFQNIIEVLLPLFIQWMARDFRKRGVILDVLSDELRIACTDTVDDAKVFPKLCVIKNT